MKQKQTQTFEQWMRQVDIEAEKLAGLSTSDLPDWRYYDAYEEGYAPKRAARAAVKAAKDDMGF